MKNKTEILDWLFSLEDTFVTGGWSELWQENAHLQPCWEVMSCSKKRCPAYGQKNARCWQVAGTFCEKTKNCESHATKWQDCRSCKVFLKATPTRDARIGELLNNIVFSIRASDPNTLVQKRFIRRHLGSFVKFNQLSSRESEVLSLILDGYSRRRIATTLHLAEETVKMHVKRLYRRIDVGSREGLFRRILRYARQRELRVLNHAK